MVKRFLAKPYAQHCKLEAYALIYHFSSCFTLSVLSPYSFGRIRFVFTSICPQNQHMKSYLFVVETFCAHDDLLLSGQNRLAKRDSSFCAWYNNIENFPAKYGFLVNLVFFFGYSNSHPCEFFSSLFSTTPDTLHVFMQCWRKYAFVAFIVVADICWCQCLSRIGSVCIFWICPNFCGLHIFSPFTLIFSFQVRTSVCWPK